MSVHRMGLIGRGLRNHLLPSPLLGAGVIIVMSQKTKTKKLMFWITITVKKKEIKPGGKKKV